MKTRTTFKTITLTALLISANFGAVALATEGGASTGGGNGINNEFFDAYLIRREIRPEEQTAYKAIIAPILDRLEQDVPDFAQDLKKALQKNWYLVDRKLPALSQKETGIILDTKQLALQNEEDVYIDSNWYNSAKTKDEDRATLFLHELVQGLRLRKNNIAEIAPENVFRATSNLMSKKQKTTRELVEMLENRGFGSYVPASEKEKIQELVKTYQFQIEEICSRHELSDFENNGVGYVEMRPIFLDLLNRQGILDAEAYGLKKLGNIYSSPGKKYLADSTRFISIFTDGGQTVKVDVRETCEIIKVLQHEKNRTKQKVAKDKPKSDSEAADKQSDANSTDAR